MAMDKAERAALRRAVIAGPGDCVLEPDEAAAFLGVGERWLRDSDVPRAPNVAGPKYLKSQLIAYVEVRLTHRILKSA